MRFDDGHNDWDDNEFPIAYLITFRTYGTWLHGDERSSTRRNKRSVRELKRIEPNVPFEASMRERMEHGAIVLNREQRKAVQEAIKEFCKAKGCTLYAINVRTNHVHVVIGVQAKPERVADAFKAAATNDCENLDCYHPKQGLVAWAKPSVSVEEPSRWRRCRIRSLFPE